MKALKNKILHTIYVWLQKLGFKPPGKIQDRYITKMIGLGEMVGSVIHEVANPLFSLTNSVEQLRAMNGLSVIPKEDFIRAVLTFETNLQRISHILSSLKNYCRDEAEQPYNQICLKEIFLDAIDLSQEQLKKFHIRFLFNMEDENLLVECRPSQILQCILNLLNNSIHAVSTLEDKWISIRVVSVGRNVKIITTDSGKGIAKDIQEKIMTPFFTTKKTDQGIGLGLSLSKRIIEAHNGNFTLDTHAPHTTFQITLPKLQFRSTYGIDRKVA